MKFCKNSVKVRKQGMDENTLSCPAAEHVKKKDKEDYTTSVAKDASCNRCSVVFFVFLFRHVGFMILIFTEKNFPPASVLL